MFLSYRQLKVQSAEKEKHFNKEVGTLKSKAEKSEHDALGNVDYNISTPVFVTLF